MGKKVIIISVVLAFLVVDAVLIYSYVVYSRVPQPLSISADSVVFKRGCISADSSCLYVSFQFPVVKGVIDQAVSVLLYADYLQAIGDSSKLDASGTMPEYLNRVALQYDSLFTEYQSAFPQGAVNTWYLKSRFDTLLNDAGLLSIQYYTENYMGGAHGNYSYHYFNVAPQLLRIVSLSDIISDMTIFMEKAEDCFRKHFNIPQGKSLEEYWFSNSTFQLPGEFGLSREGVVLHYNVYEIGPYSDGDIRFIVPYSDLKEVLMPDYSYLAKP